MSRDISAPAATAPGGRTGSSGSWDPEQYERFGDQRGRAFFDLVARLRCEDPREVVDLGCGPGGLTATLAQRWPRARVLGIDGSAEMIETARRRTAAETAEAAEAAPGGRLEFQVGDVARWSPERPVDVIVSNAVLHWIPDHRELLPRWVAALTPGGRLAFQVPGNFDAPSHTILRELCMSPRWRQRLAAVAPGRPVDDSLGYLELLTGLGCAVDAWETTYAQVLPGDDPVLEWMKGTALRPMLGLLGEGSGDGPGAPATTSASGPAADFLTDYAERLRAAYPAKPYGTVFPFRRVFVVARTPGGGDHGTSGPPRSTPERSA